MYGIHSREKGRFTHLTSDLRFLLHCRGLQGRRTDRTRESSQLSRCQLGWNGFVHGKLGFDAQGRCHSVKAHPCAYAFVILTGLGIKLYHITLYQAGLVIRHHLFQLAFTHPPTSLQSGKGFRNTSPCRLSQIEVKSTSIRLMLRLANVRRMQRDGGLSFHLTRSFCTGDNNKGNQA